MRFHNLTGGHIGVYSVSLTFDSYFRAILKMKASKLRVFNYWWLNWQVHLHYIQMAAHLYPAVSLL